MATTPIKAIEAYKANVSNTNNKEVESPLYELKSRIKWDYSYYISKEESANGYWKRVDRIEQIPLHAAATHKTHPVEEPDNLFLYKIYQYLLTLHQELQKARHDWLREEIVKLEDRQLGWLGKEEDGSDRHPNYDEIQTIIDRYQSELDQPDALTK